MLILPRVRNQPPPELHLELRLAQNPQVQTGVIITLVMVGILLLRWNLSNVRSNEMHGESSETACDRHYKDN